MKLTVTFRIDEEVFAEVEHSDTTIEDTYGNERLVFDWFQGQEQVSLDDVGGWMIDEANQRAEAEFRELELREQGQA